MIIYDTNHFTVSDLMQVEAPTVLFLGTLKPNTTMKKIALFLLSLLNEV